MIYIIQLLRNIKQVGHYTITKALYTFNDKNTTKPNKSNFPHQVLFYKESTNRVFRIRSISNETVRTLKFAALITTMMTIINVVCLSFFFLSFSFLSIFYSIINSNAFRFESGLINRRLQSSCMLRVLRRTSIHYCKLLWVPWIHPWYHLALSSFLFGFLPLFPLLCLVNINYRYQLALFSTHLIIKMLKVR